MSSGVSPTRAERRRQNNKLPVGWIAGLFTACAMTLLGVCFGHEPFTILKRAFVSALILGLLMSTGASIVRTANIDARHKRRRTDRK